VLDEILKQIDYMLVLAPLNPRPKGSREIWVTCPKCGKNEAFIFRDGRSIICRRGNQCGQTTELLELVSGIPRARGEDFLKACEELAKVGGAPFERRRMTPEQRLRIEAMEIRADALTLLRDAASANLKAQFDNFTGGAGVDYLQSRGFDVVKCLEYGFGLIENVEELDGVMTKKQLEEVGFYAVHEGAGYFSQKWEHRITIPLCDHRGRLQGFAGRTYKDHKQKYMNTRGTSLKDLVAIELAPALEHGSTIIGVEGFLDPFKARMHGIPNVVAVGTTGKALSPERWEALYNYGVKQFVFITDNDKAGAKGLEAALAAVDQAKKAPDVFTLELPEGKDLDEWIDIQNSNNLLVSEEFGRLYRQRLHSDRLRAKVFATSLDCSSEGDRWSYLQRCMDYDASVKEPRRLISLVNHFWPEVQSVSGADVEVIRDVCEKLRTNRRNEEKKKAVETALSLTKEQLKTSTPEEVIREVVTKVQAIEEAHRIVRPSLVLPPTELLSADLTALEEIAGRDFLGIPQQTLPTLDVMLSGLRGLTVLGGETNIGKTILLVQFAVGALLADQQVCCLFASLEMPPRTLRFRILSYLTGLSLQRLAKAVRAGNPDVMDACDFMERVILPRLRFIHPLEPVGTEFTVDSVFHEVESLKAETGATQCLTIVDFLGIWPVDESKFKTDTMVQKRQIEDLVEISHRCGPTITVSEIRKKQPGDESTEKESDDFMGSARSLYRADNLVAVYRFSDRMLVEHFESNMGFLRTRASPKRIDTKTFKSDETREQIEEIRAEMDKYAIFPLQLKVTKVRDGGKKGKINIMMFWEQSAAQEGLNFERTR